MDNIGNSLVWSRVNYWYLPVGFLVVVISVLCAAEFAYYSLGSKTALILGVASLVLGCPYWSLYRRVITLPAKFLHQVRFRRGDLVILSEVKEAEILLQVAQEKSRFFFGFTHQVQSLHQELREWIDTQRGLQVLLQDISVTTDELIRGYLRRVLDVVREHPVLLAVAILQLLNLRVVLKNRLQQRDFCSSSDSVGVNLARLIERVENRLADRLFERTFHITRRATLL